MENLSEIKSLEGKQGIENLFFLPSHNCYYKDYEIQDMQKFCTSRQFSKIQKSLIKTLYTWTWKTGYTRQGIYTAYRINEKYIQEDKK